VNLTSVQVGVYGNEAEFRHRWVPNSRSGTPAMPGLPNRFHTDRHRLVDARRNRSRPRRSRHQTLGRFVVVAVSWVWTGLASSDNYSRDYRLGRIRQLPARPTTSLLLHGATSERISTSNVRSSEGKLSSSSSSCGLLIQIAGADETVTRNAPVRDVGRVTPSKEPASFR